MAFRPPQRGVERASVKPRAGVAKGSRRRNERGDGIAIAVVLDGGGTRSDDAGYGRQRAAGKEPVMNRYWAEFYAQERTKEFLREAAEARLAASARQRRVERPSKPGPHAPKLVGRLLVLLRRAVA
jgi:hypothetical protein